MKMGGLLSGAVGPSSAADDPSASSGQALREKLIHNWNEKVKYPCSIIWRWFLLSYPNSECFVSQNTSMNSFPTQKSNKFGISIMTDRSFSEKRKIRNEYKTKKTAFQKDTAGAELFHPHLLLGPLLIRNNVYVVLIAR